MRNEPAHETLLEAVAVEWICVHGILGDEPCVKCRPVITEAERRIEVAREAQEDAS